MDDVQATDAGGARVALSIAGSDPSGGAGIQADLKTFSALGVYGTAVLTALTAQNTRGVSGVHVVPADFVGQQLGTLAQDVRVDAVKIGMLATAEVADAVLGFLTAHPQPSVILDPVMVATSGDRLLADDAEKALRALLPLADLLTPNLPEAARLLGTGPARDLPGMRAQAQRLLDLGARRVLLKGGHLRGTADRPGAPRAVDVLAGPDGVTELTAPWVATANTHGTGCSLSSAIAAHRARGAEWTVAVRSAKEWLTSALRRADELSVGHGSGPVHHFHAAVPRWP